MAIDTTPVEPQTPDMPGADSPVTPESTPEPGVDAEGTGIPQGIEPEQLPNYAADESVLADIKSSILPHFKTARDNRQAKVEQDWLRYRDIYNCRRNVSYYEGRSKLFIPAIRKAVDTLVRIAKDAILSSPYLGIETDIPKYKDVAMDLMKWLLEDQGRIREKLPMFLRQLYIIGTSCLKVSWQKRKRKIKYRQYDHELGMSTIQERDEFDAYGPKLEVIDMRHVYVWPETAVDYDGFKIVFEDSTITKRELEDGAADGLYDAFAVARAIQRPSITLESQRLSESQSAREGMSDPKNLPKDTFDITYGWGLFQLPNQDSPQWNQIILLNDNIEDIIRVSENPWWFQKPNYLFGTLFQEHDYFYGHGIVEISEMWQYMVNDVVNQTMDVGTFTLNPITVYDPAMVDDPDDLEVQPMAKWGIPPTAIEIIRPPVDMAQNGIQMIQFLMNVVQETSDAPAIIQGVQRTGMGPAANTATGVTQITSAANSAVVDQVDMLQTQVFTPLAQYTEIMGHEFIDEDMVIRKVGQDGVVITQRVIRPQDLMLATDVRWIASNRLREKAAKIQQLLNFYNIASKTPPQVTQQQGFTINFKEIIKDIYGGLGLENTDRVIQDTTIAVPGIPPEFENELLDAGRTVVASPYDLPANHQAHIQAHMMHKPKSELARVRMMEHIASHYQAIQQAQMQMEAMVNAGSANGKGGPGTALQQPGTPGIGVRPQEQPQSEEPSDGLAGVLAQAGGQ